MAKGYVVYNPLAGNGQAQADAQLLQVVLDEELEYYDITRITNYEAFMGGMEREDYLVVVGGDGTLNRFVNDTDGLEIPQEILYFPSGTGNDFAKDMGMAEHLRPIQEKYNDLMKNKDYLESVYKKGAESAFSIARRTVTKVKKKVGFII